MLHNLLNRAIKVGTLTVINAQGKSRTYKGQPGPEVIIRFLNKALEWKLCLDPHLALGEAYMDGTLKMEKGSIYDLLDLCGLNIKRTAFSYWEHVAFYINYALRLFHQHNPVQRSKGNVAHHYDLSRELYELFLDTDKQYSCAYFPDLNASLEEAQLLKKQHIANKLRLEPGQKILDIGSGWGGLAIYLAKNYDVEVLGLTLSTEQYEVATQRAKALGLADRVRFVLKDYRQEKGLYDRIVSVGMFEHVGIKHYSEFFNKICTLLKPEGVSLLHSIGYSHGPSHTNTWIRKYIFPGGYCPALSETLGAIESKGLVVGDIEVLHLHYAQTLRLWRARFLKNWDKAKVIYDERFCRMWEYYLASCEIAFRHRGFMVFQILLAHNGEDFPLTREYMYPQALESITERVSA